VTDKDATMTDDEIAFRAAINVLRDTLEKPPDAFGIAARAGRRRAA
jgi:hypothetical protein